MATADSIPHHHSLRPPLPSSRRMGTFGMYLFLASLSMLFLASMAAYAVTRVELYTASDTRTYYLQHGAIHLPLLLWLSTFIMVCSSATIHYAGLSVALERQRQFRNGLLATLVLAFTFLFVQTPALVQLMQSQKTLAVTDIRFYLIIAMLIVLHALHVIGGIIPLCLVTIRAFKGRYDHEAYHGVTYIALYWHFLDIVWIVMFSMLQLLR